MIKMDLSPRRKTATPLRTTGISRPVGTLHQGRQEDARIPGFDWLPHFPPGGRPDLFDGYAAPGDLYDGDALGVVRAHGVQRRRAFGHKDMEFAKFELLSHHVDPPFEVAVSGRRCPDSDSFKSLGWSV